MQSSGNLGLLTEDQRRKLTELSTRQDILKLIVDKVIIDAKEALYERQKYWPDDLSNKDFYEVVGMKNTDSNLRQGLIHQHTFLKNIDNHCHLIQSNGSEILQTIREAITLLNK
jgi:hypothetical protein